MFLFCLLYKFALVIVSAAKKILKHGVKSLVNILMRMPLVSSVPNQLLLSRISQTHYRLSLSISSFTSKHLQNNVVVSSQTLRAMNRSQVVDLYQ